MKGKPNIRRTKEMWIQLASEYLLLKESNQELTIKQFCDIRSDLKYNSARVHMKKVLDEIEAGVIKAVGSDHFLPIQEVNDHVDAVEEEPERNARGPANAVDVKKAAKESEKRRLHRERQSKASENNLSAKTAGMYSKYLDPDLVKQASEGTLNNDIVFYRTKILMGLDYIEETMPKIVDLEAELDKETDDNKKELLFTRIENLNKRIANTEKLMEMFLRRVESIEQTIKKIELTTVFVVKERENVVKTKAQTKTTIMQARKFRAEQQKLKAEEAALKNKDNGSDLDKVIRALQDTRDLLPSMNNGDKQ